MIPRKKIFIDRNLRKVRLSRMQEQNLLHIRRTLPYNNFNLRQFHSIANFRLLKPLDQSLLDKYERYCFTKPRTIDFSSLHRFKRYMRSAGIRYPKIALSYKFASSVSLMLDFNHVHISFQIKTSCSSFAKESAERPCVPC